MLRPRPVRRQNARVLDSTEVPAGAGPRDATALPTLREELGQAISRLARIGLLGVLTGVLVGGVLGRLAMMLLARLNAAATGRTSDDGFEMGRFTLSGSLHLVLVAAGLGLVGAAFYFTLRGLMIGPRWFRLLSISVGAAVVTATQIVHTDGVDFTLLQPAGLAIALFVALPVVYVAVLSVWAESVIAGERLTSRTWTAVGLAVWLPFAPLLGGLVVGRLGLAGARRTRVLRAAVTSPLVPWLLRGALSVLFVVALASLVADARVLV